MYKNIPTFIKESNWKFWQHMLKLFGDGKLDISMGISGPEKKVFENSSQSVWDPPREIDCGNFPQSKCCQIRLKNDKWCKSSWWV